jgi:hypothetical protein
LDPEADVAHIVPVSRVVLELARALLQHFELLAGVLGHLDLQPAHVLQPAGERVFARVGCDCVLLGLEFVLQLQLGLERVVRTQRLVEIRHVAAALEWHDVLLGRFPLEVVCLALADRRSRIWRGSRHDRRRALLLLAMLPPALLAGACPRCLSRSSRVRLAFCMLVPDRVRAPMRDRCCQTITLLYLVFVLTVFAPVVRARF